MKTSTVKINVNHLKKEIDSNFFKFRDIFFKCFIINLCMHDRLCSVILNTSIIEDSNYNQMLLTIINNNVSNETILSQLDTPYNYNIFLDTSIYFDDFIKLKHNLSKINVYQLTIDDDYNICVTNKWIDKNVK